MNRFLLLVASVAVASSAAADPIFLTARASVLDPKAREYPEAGFVFGTGEKPADKQTASYDPDVTPRGELVIWLMNPSEPLFERLNSYGLHVIQPHYARGWFGKLCREEPVGEMCRGDVRLEAATGRDVSDQIDLQRRDGMTARATRFLKHLQGEQPEADWGQFLKNNGTLNFDRVIVAGASHGASTAARFAVDTEVARVVMFCGARDQYQSWQGLPSATPANRYFGFSHTLDQGWEEDHYCRSWQMLGLAEFGPIVDVDETVAPFGNSRRLITSGDVGGDARRAHSSVKPGGAAVRDEDGGYAHEAVWRYLFTHPVDAVGMAVPPEADCDLNQRD